MHDVLIVAGAMSLALLWGFAALGAAASLSDTFGEHLERLAERFRR